MILYIKENCPYSLAVLHKIEEMNLKPDIRSVNQNRHALELIEKGGKFQVPCLVDPKNDVVMYESQDIMDYFDTLDKK